jgi:hypothetical protein
MGLYEENQYVELLLKKSEKYTKKDFLNYIYNFNGYDITMLREMRMYNKKELRNWYSGVKKGRVLKDLKVLREYKINKLFKN